MKFVTYKTTNTVTGEYYFGSHKTEDFEKDPYLGSGKKLNELIKLYGEDCFTRETLGEFDTRQEAFDLEQKLIAEHKGDKLCLNMNDGGCAAFLSERRHERCVEEYRANPKHCIHCGKELPYEKRENNFCNSSCAAIHNNTGRVVIARKSAHTAKCYGKRLFKCPWCGKEEWIPKSNLKQYCDNHCQRQYQLANGLVSTITDKGQRLEDNKEEIIKRYLAGEKKSVLAEEFSVTKQMMGEYLNKKWRVIR